MDKTVGNCPAEWELKSAEQPLGKTVKWPEKAEKGHFSFIRRSKSKLHWEEAKQGSVKKTRTV